MQKMLIVAIGLLLVFTTVQYTVGANADMSDITTPGACNTGIAEVGLYNVHLHHVGSILDIVGSCYTQSIELTVTPSAGVSWPAPLGYPLHGFIPLNKKEFPLFIDRRADIAVLSVDLDRSGLFREIAWMRQLADGRLMTEALFHLTYKAEEKTLPYPIFLIWNPLFPNSIAYCRASYRRGEIKLGGEVYRIALVDENTDGRYDDLYQTRLYIDLDRDGVFLATCDSHERYWLSAPFNIKGTVYRVVSVSPGGTRMRVEETDEWVEEISALTVGSPAPLFTAIDRAGEEISLAALRGRIVLLVFWAEWCPACRVKLPQLEAIAADYAADGVVMIGINLDWSEDDFFQAIMKYDFFSFNIFDGSSGPIAALYRVRSIPFLYLIDREGTIRGRGLRGEGVRQAIATLLDGQR